jgi:hypothetical protein
MRTTVEIDDDLLNAARRMADARSVTIGEVICEWMRRGLHSAEKPQIRNGIPVFQVGPNSPSITLADVQKAEDEP